MSRGWIVWKAVALSALLASCGPGAENSAVPNTASAGHEALETLRGKLRLCPAAQEPGKSVCAAKAALALSEEVAGVLAAQAMQLTPEGRRLLIEDQAEWARMELEVCTRSADAALTVPECMQRALTERLRNADLAVQAIGGYVLQRVERLSATPLPTEEGEAANAQFGPPVVTTRISWPRIDAPPDAKAQRFNETAAELTPSSKELVETAVDYAIAYAGPALISVQFTTYSYAPGAAHPSGGGEALNFLMGEGRLLEPEDVFQAGSAWEMFLVNRAAAGLEDVFAEFGAPPSAELLRDAVVKPRLWVISENGLTLLFPPYALGGPWALGAQQVRIGWAELQPYLRADAPAPFGSS
jgi:hypothetical protein